MNNGKLKLAQALVRWNKGGGVFVYKLQPMQFSRQTDFWTTYHLFPEDGAIIVLLADALAMICRDKCDPMTVHTALMAIAEYADAVPTDLTGMNCYDN